MKPEEIINAMDKKMSQAIEHLVKEFSAIRTGRANSGLIDGLMVDYYGTPTLLQQLANITVPDAKTTPKRSREMGSILDLSFCTWSSNSSEECAFLWISWNPTFLHLVGEFAYELKKWNPKWSPKMVFHFFSS